jgi:hypothetical protein
VHSFDLSFSWILVVQYWHSFECMEHQRRNDIGHQSMARTSDRVRPSSLTYPHYHVSLTHNLCREAIFFVLTTHLILLSSSLISHLHHLLVLSPPSIPSMRPHVSRCPPKQGILHILLLAMLALEPPTVDEGVLQALCLSEDTLRKGSKSFTLAKLGWGREIRCGLVAVYGWCRITVSLAKALTSLLARC